ncbi:hypothetical protein ACLBXX_07700 [Microbacterium sp. C23T]
MGVMFDYFAAPNDEEAAATIDRPGGPAQPEVVPQASPARRTLFGRRRPAIVSASDSASAVVYDTVSVKGIDPVVQLGTLEGLLTGRTFDDVLADPRTGHDLAIRDGGELLVVTINDAVSAALGTADEGTLEQVAGPWSQTEEFWGRGDPTELAGFLKDLAGLARRAQASGDRLYCWICV